MAKYANLFNGGTPGAEGLPFSQVTASSADGAVAPSEPDGQLGKGFRLLFVDDEGSVLKALRRIFMDENYKISTASSAEQALEMLSGQAFHLVISDHRMPGLSGAELLKQVKSRWPDTIRIMLTGHADVQSVMGAVNEGAVYKFITKPWNDEDLRLTVSLALQQYLLVQENKSLRIVTHQQKLKLKKVTQLLGENHAFLGNLLVKAELIEPTQFQQALQDCRPDEFITESLARLGFVSENKLARTLQERLHLDNLDLKEVNLSREVVRLFPRDLCIKHCMLPVQLAGKEVTLALADPSDIYKLDDLARMTGLKVNPVIARAGDIRKQLLLAHGKVDGGDWTLMESPTSSL